MFLQEIDFKHCSDRVLSQVQLAAVKFLCKLKTQAAARKNWKIRDTQIFAFTTVLAF